MARHLDETLALYKVVKASDRILQVGSQGCSDSKWHTAGQVMKSGKIGHKVWSQASYCRNNPNGEWNYGIDSNANASNVDWAQWLGSAPKREWSPERYLPMAQVLGLLHGYPQRPVPAQAQPVHGGDGRRVALPRFLQRRH